MLMGGPPASDVMGGPPASDAHYRDHSKEKISLLLSQTRVELYLFIG